MQTLSIKRDRSGVATVRLNRLEQRNAVDEQMMDELLQVLHQLGNDSEIHVLILTGAGHHFSAGVDLHWFRDLISGDMEDLEDATRKHVRLMRTLHDFPKPSIARVQGATIAMSVGLAVCCDMTLCTENTYFSFPEIRAGTVPGPAAPYLINVVGSRRIARYFMSGERISAHKAVQLGLVDECYPDVGSMDEAIQGLVNELLLGSPRAQTLCKRMVNNISGMQQRLDKLDSYTADTLAHMYTEAEGIDGARAFFSKKTPPWFQGRFGKS